MYLADRNENVENEINVFNSRSWFIFHKRRKTIDNKTLFIGKKQTKKVTREN
jgi:hypothetical protein